MLRNSPIALALVPAWGLSPVAAPPRTTPVAGRSATAQLLNTTDTTHWRWIDARGPADSSAVKDAYTAPGRNLQPALRHDF